MKNNKITLFHQLPCSFSLAAFDIWKDMVWLLRANRNSCTLDPKPAAPYMKSNTGTFRDMDRQCAGASYGMKIAIGSK
ncbi:hypothetical protein [Sphingorhabdus sp. Alg239-R122]|uniref:hypothetical protein n=1 Tax=Sphingorhabdus sp. Alg239-R122 TaxID=2305989 RepID=UPI0019673034|nr:hypothetical protein [Sphingorhabdus sp. Alg239-R122]